MRMQVEYLVKLQEMQTIRATMRTNMENFKYEMKLMNRSESVQVYTFFGEERLKQL